MVYCQLLPFSIFFAGNNAMEEEDGDLIVGRKEPFLLHAHILGRGASQHQYIEGIPFDAPSIGEEFDLKGNGSPEENRQKLPWTQEAMMKFHQHIQTWLISSAVPHHRFVSFSTSPP
eukprot:TRINITY_DN7266_c0_g1_i3.p2 TRINITY_DN7266_c0_g1~~TRINITY_DN7266_c0_g1_i3.p2  ORF type:complete len:117 (-),score=28.80 TRINITY_DN7266_c0_g1_i3:32-382(-)